MQREDGEDILPFPMVRSDAGTAFFLGNGDHMVDNTQTLGFSLGFDGASGFGFSVSDPIEPIAYPIMATNLAIIEGQVGRR